MFANDWRNSLVNCITTLAGELWHEATASFKFNAFCTAYSVFIWAYFVLDTVTVSTPEFIMKVDWSAFWPKTAMGILSFIIVRIVGEWAVKKIKAKWARFKKPSRKVTIKKK
jgi:hypothetical protein